MDGVVTPGAEVGEQVDRYSAHHIGVTVGPLQRVERSGTKPHHHDALSTLCLSDIGDRRVQVAQDRLVQRLRLRGISRIANAGEIEAEGRDATAGESPSRPHVKPPDP